jgi:hypothetical protein
MLEDIWKEGDVRERRVVPSRKCDANSTPVNNIQRSKLEKRIVLPIRESLKRSGAISIDAKI